MSTNRRDFMKASAVTATGLGVGFVAASQPVLAQVIKTDFAGIKAGELSIPSGGIQMPAYVSRPEKAKGPLPIVIVCSEIFGVHEYIADTTRRLAKLGYLAIAPEFFVRAGDPNMYGTVPEIFTNIISKTPDAQVLGDIRAAIAWAGANGGDLKRVGVTGFCWGGRITWLSATMPEVRAGVAWYGRLVGQTSALTPKNPVDVGAALHAPVLGLYGAADTGIPLDTLDKMKAVLANGTPAAKASTFVVYPDAPHAFHADYRPSFRPAAAEDGWKRALAWMAQHGVA